MSYITLTDIWCLVYLRSLLYLRSVLYLYFPHFCQWKEHIFVSIQMCKNNNAVYCTDTSWYLLTICITHWTNNLDNGNVIKKKHITKVVKNTLNILIPSLTRQMIQWLDYSFTLLTVSISDTRDNGWKETYHGRWTKFVLSIVNHLAANKRQNKNNNLNPNLK